MTRFQTVSHTKKMSIAAMMRALTTGAKLTMIESPLSVHPHRLIGKPMFAIRANARGVLLGESPTDTDGLLLKLPNAMLVELDGNELRIYMAGHRPLTEEEKYVYDNMPSKRPENAMLAGMGAATDGSEAFWMDVKWCREHGMEYLKHKKVRGMIVDSNVTSPLVRDDHVRGDLLFRFRVELPQS